MRDIIVHMDETAQSHARLAVAKRLGAVFGARISGLFTHGSEGMHALTASGPSEQTLSIAGEARRLFMEECGPSGRWMEILHGQPDFQAQEIAFCARYSNLMVLGQPGGTRHASDRLIDRVILDSGSPALVVPGHGHFEKIGQNILIAWNAGRECARAVHDALPLLRSAASVTLVVMNSAIRPEGARDDLPPVGIIDHLEANGVPARLEHLRGEGVGIMDLLLSRAADGGADLLVMGVGTHGLFSSLGAGYRHVLGHMTLPVLFSH